MLTSRRLGAILAGGLLLWACGGQDTDSSPGVGGAGGVGQGGSGGAAQGGSGPTVLPIAEVKAWDEQGVPLMLGQRVTVRGVVTVPTDVFSLENHELYLQDATGGISVYEVNWQSIQAALGDDLEVTGTVGHYEGKTELDQPVFVLRATGLAQPEPQLLTTAELCANGEPYESNLVRFETIHITGGEAWPTVDQEGNTNIIVDDGTGPCPLRLDHHTEFNGSPEPAQPFSAVGVVKQYDETSPYFSGYELQPRFLTDITGAQQ